jgi:HPt (histidine-containing phosphotransfer) domain-containing protein
MTKNFAVPPELRINYLRRKVEELETSKVHLENRDFSFIKTLAHQMRGNATTFEFPLLAELGALLESAALAENPSQTKLILGDIQRAVDGLLKRLLKP